MNWIVTRIKLIMLIAGVLTSTMLYAGIVKLRVCVLNPYVLPRGLHPAEQQYLGPPST